MEVIRSGENGINGRKERGMKKAVHKAVIRFAIFVNIMLVTLPFAFCWFWSYADGIVMPYYRRGNFLLIALFVLLYIVFGRTYDAFLISYYPFLEMLCSQAIALLMSDLIMYIVISLLSLGFVNVCYLLITFGVQLSVTAFWCLMTRKLYFTMVNPKLTAVIYDEQPDVGELIKKYRLGRKFNVVRVATVKDCMDGQMTILEGMEVVFVCGVHSHDRNIILKYCIGNNIRLFVIPRVGDVLMSSAKRVHILHLPMLMVERYSPSVGYLFFKRMFDIVFSVTVLFLASPLMILTAVAIKLYDGGQVFYRQCRLTKDGKCFFILKFRSMRVDAEENGVQLCSGGEDDRVTPVGRVIRRLHIDELPQMLNIVSGSMSVVGPRPERPELEEQYLKELPEFRLRLQAKAGLTGYAQVYGKYNTTPYDKLQMDLMYISNPGILEDLRIVLATIKVLFLPESGEILTKRQAVISELAAGEEKEKEKEK